MLRAFIKGNNNTQCRNVPKMTSERSRIPCLSAAAAEGTGKKQQEGRAMATLDRKVPSPEAFLGNPWSSWIDAAKLHCSDNVDLEEAGKEGGKSREVMRLNKEDVDLEEAGKEGGKSREVMRLNKEDMHLFGHYPAHDDFYLVVCSACNQVIKPQVFQSHCGKWTPAPGGCICSRCSGDSRLLLGSPAGSGLVSVSAQGCG
ncbi:Ataxin-7-like protein 1 [Tupaia chinensis]|uniref:Ataxin-7-like protein 1 n=1 Tax=Tupaia chinensis TaxID=246437 RepID=L9KSX2_TUPCH|nr:Ataxin-7-like protein 1 [Tupaia chinensis]